MEIKCKNCGAKLQTEFKGERLCCDFCGSEFMAEALLLDSGISKNRLDAYRQAVRYLKLADSKEDFETVLEFLDVAKGIFDSDELMKECEEGIKALEKKESYQRMVELCEAEDVYSLNCAIRLLKENPHWENSRERILQCENKIAAIEREEELREQKDRRALRRKSIKSAIVTVLVLVIIAVGTVFYTVYQSRKYDTERIDTELLSMTSEYDPDASPYIEGCYYLYFDFEIENETYTEIDSISLTTSFKDKSGRVIYRVSSSFGGYGSSGLHLKPEEKVCLQTYLKENAMNPDPAFSKIYGTDLSAWEISISIDSVGFSDGKNY